MRGSGGSKSRLAKAAGAEVAAQRRNEKWHAAVARSAFSSQNAQNTAGADQFWRFRSGKKWHAAVARSTFASQNAQNTIRGPIFEIPIQKMAHWCQAHLQVKMSKKIDGFGPLLEVPMSKNVTPLWREALLPVKMWKKWGVRATFWSSDVEKIRQSVS